MTPDLPPALPPPESETWRHDLGDIARERVIIEDQSYLIDHPAEPVRLLDLPEVRCPSATDENLPYWAELWPAARMLAQVIAHEPWTPGTEALEIGCGLGLPGIVALAKGLRVTFSDYDPTALCFAASNARLNGFQNFKTLRLDWRCPPAELQVPVLLASDLVYEMRNVEPLVNFVKKVLAPGALCLMTDKNRLPALTLREALGDSGLAFTTDVVRLAEPGSKRVKGTLYRILGCQ